MRIVRAALCVLLAGAFLLSCGGTEAKKMKFHEKGKALYARGQYVKAGLEFKNAIQIDPKFADAHYRLGMTQVMRGDLGGAFRSIRRAVELDPKNHPAQVQLGLILLVGGEKDKAMEKAELVLAADPANENAALLKGAVYVVGKESGKAVPYLQGIIEKGGAGPEPYILLARVHVQEKDLGSAESVLLRGVKAHDNSVVLHRALADVYAAGGRVDDSAARIRRIGEMEPGNWRSTIGLAGLYWDAGRKEKAREVADGLLAARPADDAVRLDVARLYDSRRSFADAERVLLAGIGKERKSLGLRLALGELYRNAGRTDQAFAALTQLLSLEKDASDPIAVRARIALARIHLARQEPKEAEARVDEVIREDPRNVDARLIKGRIALGMRDGAAAVAQYRTIVSENPQFLEGRLLLAQAYLLKKENGLALETLQNAVKADPRSGEARKALARYYVTQGDFRAAEGQLRDVAESDPRDIGLRAELGDLLAAAKEPARAESEYARVKKIAPRHPLGYVKLGEHYARQKKWDLAAVEFRQAAALDPRFYGVLGGFHHQRKEYRKAVEAYEKLLEKQPGSWAGSNDLAALLCDHGSSAKDLDRALALAEAAARSRPDEPAVLDTLGWAHYRKGDPKRALEYLARAGKRMGDNPEFNYHVGMAHAKTGDRERAKEFLKKSVDSKKTFCGSEEAARTLVGL